MFGNLINQAMGAASKLPSLVKNMITKDVQVYDASKHQVIIAGNDMTGWEYAHISDVEVTKEILGLNSNEFALVKQVYVKKLSISFLPTETCIKDLETLASLCLSWNKYFVITIIENGTWVADYYAQFSSVGGIKMQAEGENVVFEFYLKPISTRSVENLYVTDGTPQAIEIDNPVVPTPDPLPNP